MEVLMDNLIGVAAGAIALLIGMVIKYWNKTYGGITPSKIINEKAVLEFIVKMAKEKNLQIEQKEDVDFLVEFGRLQLQEKGIKIDKTQLEKVVNQVKVELKK